MNHRDIRKLMVVTTLSHTLEKVHCNVYESEVKASVEVARRIAEKIQIKNKKKEPFVLGCCTGSSPIFIYQELARLYKTEKLDFRHVILFSLDEYYPIQPKNEASFHFYIHHHLVHCTNIQANNVFLLDGSKASIKELKNRCAAYDNAIKKAGKIDIQLLGIGSNGHIGFNEPGSLYASRVRRVSLDVSSRQSNLIHFDHSQNIPQSALSMGIANILEASEIILIAWGEKKASAILESVEKEPTEKCPASLLQYHPNTTFYLDHEAASMLTRYQKPWLAGEIEWDNAAIKKAVIQLALELKKPLLSLTEKDYINHGLSELLVEVEGGYYGANLRAFYILRDSITGWPGGKLGSHRNEKRPTRAKPFPKKILIFSPHPDDDIISMGGTFLRLHEQGHEVHVGYQTSGNVAVSDAFVVRLLNLVNGFERKFGIATDITPQILKEAKAFLKSKTKKQKDTESVRAIKGLIRKYEALATCNYVGLPDKRAHFMNLPFYETGLINKNPATQKDIDITKKLLRSIKPHQLYVAADILDPHGTHKVCLEIVLEALQQIKYEKDEWIKHCWLWLYKGAWQEWKMEEIDMAIPMSPEQVLIKRHGIFIHQSQKDDVPFLGNDTREFWQRAEDRNKRTAALYAQLGLPTYEAMEAFARKKF